MISQNLPPVKARMPQAHQDSQLKSISIQHDRSYLLSRQGCHKHLNTVSFISHHSDRTYKLSSHKCQKHIKTAFSFIPASDTMAELTNCQAKNMWHINTISFIPPPAAIQQPTSCHVGQNATTVSKFPASQTLSI
jgi:hypothetical protein